MVEFDVEGAFDNLDHGLLMEALRTHTDCKWVLLYIERWLKAPSQDDNGTFHERNRGTPQGGVISPLLMNLFMHYAFDRWMRRTVPACPFARYADDAVVHGRSQRQAESVKQQIAECFAACGLAGQDTDPLLQRQQPTGRLPNRAVHVSGFYIYASQGAPRAAGSPPAAKTLCAQICISLLR